MLHFQITALYIECLSKHITIYTLTHTYTDMHIQGLTQDTKGIFIIVICYSIMV